MILGAIGSIISGIAAFQQASYQAAISKANAKQAQLNANLASDVANEEAEDIGVENKGLLGELESGQAASGLSIASPSAVRGRSWMRSVAYKDQLRRVEAGNREFANYRTQANVFNAEAKAQKTAGVFSLIGGIVEAGASFAGSAQPGRMSPGFLPFRTTRNRYNPGRSLVGVA